MSLSPASTKALMRRLLDRGYAESTRQLIRTFALDTHNGPIAAALTGLEAEIKRLDLAGEKLRADNPYLRVLLGDAERVLQARARTITDAGIALQTQTAGIAASIARRIVFGEVSGTRLTALARAWQQPPVSVLNSVVSYTSRPAWQKTFNRFGADIASSVQKLAIREIAQGFAPMRIARDLRKAFNVLPVRTTNTMLRTLQLQSYRDMTTATYLANSDIIEYQIRIASLDDRCCLACWALHGTIMDLGETVTDHYNGRCTSVVKIKGVDRATIPTGAEQWSKLSAARQIEIAGPSNYAAIRSGIATLSDFAENRRDPIFGDMIQQAALSGILGKNALKTAKGR